MLTENDILVLNDYVKNCENAIAIVSEYNNDIKRLKTLEERVQEIKSMHNISEVRVNNVMFMTFLADDADLKSKLLDVIQVEIDALKKKIDAYKLPKYISNK